MWTHLKKPALASFNNHSHQHMHLFSLDNQKELLIQEGGGVAVWPAQGLSQLNICLRPCDQQGALKSVWYLKKSFFVVILFLFDDIVIILC